MWIERVVARAFGPLRDDTLELGEGMTVIAGPNEAGKTSWHAATRLALTGVRRGPGLTREARSVIERHRPWDDQDRWEVEARLHLADGRTIDISQDLLGRVACRARDVVLGDDVSGEVINEGTPDASMWLGLDRESFTSVAAVNQAQILAVAENAGALQEQMQRAAATRGTDATAAEAIERLKAFRRDAVGADTRAAVGPLRTAMREQEAADGALAEARRLHGEFLEREQRLEEAERRHAVARSALAGVEAALGRREAEEAIARATRAAELAARHPTRPVALAARDEQADEVAAALEGWRNRPAPPSLDGESAAALESRLGALPPVPEGDRRPDPSVTEAYRAFELADAAVRVHGARPQVAVSVPTPAPGRFPAPLVGGALLVVAGVVAFAAGQQVPGAVMVAAGLALGGWGWLRAGSGSQAAADARATAALAARQAAEWDDAAGRLEAERAAAEQRLRDALRARGASADGAATDALAAYERACAERDALAQSAAGAEGLQRALDARRALEQSAVTAVAAAAAAEARLRAAAAGVNVPSDGAADEVVERLVAWQGRRSGAARAAEEAIREWQELEGLLAGRSLDDLRAEAERRAGAAERLRAVAAPASLPAGADPSAALGEARAAAARAKEAVDALTGEVRLAAATLPNVVEAEERALAAAAELNRVRDLAGVIEQTVELLQAAERRVHRDIAPILKASVQRHLATITGGSYDEVGVNPRDLSVDVKETRSGQWRDARLLSEGTREQVYLLLRVAMAEALVTNGEVAPLLLDEVTAQSDPERKRQVLDVLHALSTDRQVIVFTHDADVAAWAATCLTPDRDRLVRLGGW